MKSFDSIDKSFEERFDPKLRTIGESHLQNYDKQKELIPPSKYFRIEFSTSISEKTKKLFERKTSGNPGFFGKIWSATPSRRYKIKNKADKTKKSERIKKIT